MCMDEFIKKLYDFKGIYRIFWSQNNRYIFDIFNILSIYFRYILIFFQKFQHMHA